MPNQHENTAQVRGPLRTVQRLRRLAEKNGVTASTMLTQIVDAHCDKHAPEIAEETADMPVPRRSLRSGTPAPPVEVVGS